ncbi:sodium/potassium/calcium exchanger [Pycnococcus provasolii]
MASSTPGDVPYRVPGGSFAYDLFTFDELSDGYVALHFIGMLYCFVALALVCDDYFVPALEDAAKALRISHDVAGATLMAAGGSAPELATAIIGTLGRRPGVAVGTIVGSAVFNVLAVIGACAVLTPGTLKLTPWPMVRDAIFYLISLGALVGAFVDRRVMWYEALSMFTVYVAYVVFMSRNQQVKTCFARCRGRVDRSARRGDTPRPVRVLNKSVGTVATVICGPLPTLTPSVSLAETGQAAINNNTGSSATEMARLVGVPPPAGYPHPRDSNGVAEPAKQQQTTSAAVAVKEDEDVEENRRAAKDRGGCSTSLRSAASPATEISEDGRSGDDRDSEAIETSSSSSDEDAPPFHPLRSLWPSVDNINNNNNNSSNLSAADGEVTASTRLWQVCGLIWRILTWPVQIIYWATIPRAGDFDDSPPQQAADDAGGCGGRVCRCLYRYRFVATFVISVAYIAVITYLMVWFAATFGYVIGIPDEVMGITFLAIGTSAPDFITSVIVARKGHGDMAVSSSIGSNIFDSSVGLPIPWALYCAIYRQASVSVDVTGMGWSVFILMLMIVLLFVIIIASRWTLTHAAGACCFVLYAVFIAQALVITTGVWKPPFE